jgi:glycosyltransferase involved in cell wall biosynthesis
MGATGSMRTVLLKGPILSRSGYGEHARCVFRALQSRPDLYDVYIEPTNWGKTSWSYTATEENKEILHCVNKLAHFQGTFNISMQVLIPNEWQNLAEKNIGVTAGIETDLASAQWVQCCRDIDRVIVVSNHAKDVFVNSVYDDLRVDASHIDVIGYPVKNKEPEDMNLELETDFNFLAVAQAGPRKCLDATVRWFAEEFKDDNVGLVLKSNIVNNSIPDRNNLLATIKNWVAQVKDRKCKIYLLHGNLNDNQIHHLYNHDKIKCFVTTTHGEGFGLPIFEAAYSGLPVVAPAWSGHTDFLYKKFKKKNGKPDKKPLFTKVKYTLEKIQSNAVWENVIEAESKWAFNDEKSYKKSLRNVYSAYRSKKAMADELKEYIEEEMSEENIYKKYVDVVNDVYPPEVFEVSEWLQEIENNLETHE